MKRITMLVVFILCIFVIYGCKDNGSIYSGIENKDIPDTSQKTVFVYGYKGHSDKWAANFIVYKIKDTNKLETKLLLKYNGKKPYPTGEIGYSYDAGGKNVESGTIFLTDKPLNGIYPPVQSVYNELGSEKNSIVNLKYSQPDLRGGINVLIR